MWARNNPRAPALEQAVALIPDDASVTSTFNIGPHLARRRESFDWPNPFWPSYWGKEVPSQADCDNFPSASVVDYLALDMNIIGGDPNTVALIEAMTGPEGDFEIVDQELLRHVAHPRRPTHGARSRRRAAAAQLLVGGAPAGDRTRHAEWSARELPDRSPGAARPRTSTRVFPS